MSMGAVIEAAAAEAERGEEEYCDDEIEETARPVGWSLNMARSAAMRTRERRSVGPGGGLNPDDVEKPPTQSMTSNVAETPGDLPDPLPDPIPNFTPFVLSGQTGPESQFSGARDAEAPSQGVNVFYGSQLGGSQAGWAGGSWGAGKRPLKNPSQNPFAPPPPRSPPASRAADEAREPPDSPDFCEMMSQQVREVVSAAARAGDSQPGGSNSPPMERWNNSPPVQGASDDDEEITDPVTEQQAPLDFTDPRNVAGGGRGRGRGVGAGGRGGGKPAAAPVTTWSLDARTTRGRARAEEPDFGEWHREMEEKTRAELAAKRDYSDQQLWEEHEASEKIVASRGRPTRDRKAKNARFSPSQSDQEEDQDVGVARTRAQRARRSDWRTRKFFGDSQFPPSQSPGDEDEDEEDEDEEDDDAVVVSDDDAPVEDAEDDAPAPVVEEDDADDEDAWYVGGTQAFPDMIPEDDDDEEDGDESNEDEAAPPPPSRDKPLTPLGCSKCRYASNGCGRCRTMRRCDMDGTPYPWSAAARGGRGGERRERRANSRVRRPRPRPRPRPRRRIRQAFIDRYRERASCPVRGRRRGSRRRRRPAQREGALLG